MGELKPKQIEFLAAFAEHGTIKKCSRLCHMSRETHYLWLEQNPEYARQFKLAEADFADTLLDEFYARARRWTERKKKDVSIHWSDKLLFAAVCEKFPSFRESLPAAGAGNIILNYVERPEPNLIEARVVECLPDGPIENAEPRIAEEAVPVCSQ